MNFRGLKISRSMSDVLGQHLVGTAQKYYRRQMSVGGQRIKPWSMQYKGYSSLSTKITPAQSMKLFTAPMAVHRTDHFLYLTAVSDSCGGAENIVHSADPSARMMMLARLDIHRMDYLRKAEELRKFAHATEIEARTKHLGHDVVNVVDPRKTFKRKERFERQGLKGAIDVLNWVT